MTIEERIKEIDVQTRDLLDELNYLKEELNKKETKQHKSLSDYRVYENLPYGTNFKCLNGRGRIYYDAWENSDTNNDCLELGNIYANDTPNELLEREVKKRQLWFALEKHLKENNCLATSEDWKDESKLKHFVCFNYSNKSFEISCNSNRKDNTIYSTDIIVLKNYMNTLTNEDIKIMFDVE